MLDADAFAKLLCDWCLEVRESQQVLVATTSLAEPVVVSLHRELLERGAWPVVRMSPPQLGADFYTYAGAAQLESYAPVELAEFESVDASIRIGAPANVEALAGIDPELIARAMRARQPIQAARRARRWCVSLWPTPALAQQARMSERDYEAFLGRALFLDQPDPAGAWRELAARQQSLVERLRGAREVRIEAEGTDLHLRVEGRQWINSDGRRNMPSGEVFTGPLENSAHGTIRFTIPSNPGGAQVEDVELTFSDGRVTSARAARGDGYLQSALATDPGARYLGELGIGTNPGIDRATGSTLLDEKIAGTVHLALGRSYQETGGTNASALHWDLVCDLRDGGRLSVDGEPLELARSVHS
ncbi:MAG TPA: aminopeptidase [Solirubrobacteraceae bacterium]|nr:aminopeptidase [Solirubrobacteraceae bacterium]